jgi:hypothetical protein
MAGVFHHSQFSERLSSPIPACRHCFCADFFTSFPSRLGCLAVSRCRYLLAGVWDWEFQIQAACHVLLLGRPLRLQRACRNVLALLTRMAAPLLLLLSSHFLEVPLLPCGLAVPEPPCGGLGLGVSVRGRAPRSSLPAPLRPSPGQPSVNGTNGFLLIVFLPDCFCPNLPECFLVAMEWTPSWVVAWPYRSPFAGASG